MNCGNLFLEMSAYFRDFPSWYIYQYTALMAAIIRKPSKFSNGAVITTKKNQTSFGENLQFSFKTDGNTNCPIKLKQKVFKGKPSVFFSKKLKKN